VYSAIAIRMGITWRHSRVLFFTLWSTGANDAKCVIAVVTHERLDKADRLLSARTLQASAEAYRKKEI
jgi:hypothetical protein